VHSAETLPTSWPFFNAGAMFPGGTSSPVFFQRPGKIDYICRFHAGMTGSVVVGEAPEPTPPPPHGHATDPHAEHGEHDHLKHFHGFVTGGRSAKRLFMTHTPVIADERHHFQVILQSSLREEKFIAAYEKLRRSEYSDGKVQIFHDHLSLADIGAGRVKTLPKASFEYYPNGIENEGVPVPGLEQDVPVYIDHVLHFHQFDPDTDYPSGLAYLMYGDTEDVFIDHFITRAPNFHSVAKLKTVPEFWLRGKVDGALKVIIPSKHILDVSPKLIERVGFVDNAFHIFWLPPSGAYLPPPGHPQDPLLPRDNSAPIYDVEVNGGQRGQIEVGRFLHFDVRLLNYGVLIT
jgi:hypothetical protein